MRKITLFTLVLCLIHSGCDKNLASNQGLRYQVIRNKKELQLMCQNEVVGAIQLPKILSAEKNLNSISELFWNHDGRAVAVTATNSKKSFIVVYLRQADGTYKAIDLSRVEDGNLGKLGKRRSDFVSVSSDVIRWIKRADDLYQIVIETRGRESSGKVVRAEERQIISVDGVPLWR